MDTRGQPYSLTNTMSRVYLRLVNPDYSKVLVGVYTEAISATIATYGTLDALGFISHENKQRDGILSSAIDFSVYARLAIAQHWTSRRGDEKLGQLYFPLLSWSTRCRGPAVRDRRSLYLSEISSRSSMFYGGS